MRPVRRGPSPQTGDFADYAHAKPDLVSRLGAYCSYCERRIPVLLAVEHIQPKGGPHGHPDLEGRWENFLLACVNCNATKCDNQVVLADVLLPDRDNAFAALHYTQDGKVSAATGLAAAAATATLKLVGLDKADSVVADANSKAVALNRVSQRMEAWLEAEESKADVDKDPSNVTLRQLVVRLAVATGFFSIWMRVFETDPEMLRRFIDAFPGTRESGCFDATTGAAVAPAPNPDGLADGGKA